MKRSTTVTFVWLGTLLGVAALSLASACGDVETFNFRTGPIEPAEPLTDLNGALIQLVRMTEPCDSGDADALFALVSDAMEFSGERVKGLKPSCSDSPDVAVSIDLQARSIIYDFSSIVSPGVFAPANFNGYVFTCGPMTPKLHGATIDRSVTTLDLDDADLAVDGHTLMANFQNLSFDERDFVKIDLAVAEPNTP